MSLFSDLSAFVDNVATVLMAGSSCRVAICRKLDIPSSDDCRLQFPPNLQEAATLVGDTTSMMLAFVCKMDFIVFRIPRQ